MEALLEYRQTDVCYGGVRAVRGVSFTLHAGEILGVVGESGCGKSTLLRAAMGLLGPGGLVTGGKILYRGENLPDLSARTRRRLNGPELGMIFQSAGSSFCPVRRVGDQLYEMMRAHGPMDKRAFRQQAGALLDRLGLEDGPRILNSYPFELSGGQKRRVAIAGVMAMHPRVLVLDEPAAGLDPEGRDTILSQIKAYHEKTGITVLLVSHSMEDIAKYANRVLVMHRAKIAMYDTVEKVFAHAQQLLELGLSVPQVTQIFLKLRQMGLDIPADVYTIPYAVKTIRRALAAKQAGEVQ